MHTIAANRLDIQDFVGMKMLEKCVQMGGSQRQFVGI